MWLKYGPVVMQRAGLERERASETEVYRNPKQKPALKSLEEFFLEAEQGVIIGTNMEDLSIDQKKLPGVKEGKWESDAAVRETFGHSVQTCL